MDAGGGVFRLAIASASSSITVERLGIAYQASPLVLSRALYASRLPLPLQFLTCSISRTQRPKSLAMANLVAWHEAATFTGARGTRVSSQRGTRPPHLRGPRAVHERQLASLQIAPLRKI